MGRRMTTIMLVRVRGQTHAVLNVRGRVLDSLSPWLQRPEDYAVFGVVSARSALIKAGVTPE